MKRNGIPLIAAVVLLSACAPKEGSLADKAVSKLSEWYGRVTQSSDAKVAAASVPVSDSVPDTVTESGRDTRKQDAEIADADTGHSSVSEPTASPTAPGLIFKCVIANNKVVEVIQTGSQYRYSFGYENRPEIVITNSVRKVEEQSAPSGNPRAAVMTFKNGDYDYTVISGYEPVEGPSGGIDDTRTYGRVTVERGERLVSEIECVNVIKSIEL